MVAVRTLFAIAVGIFTLLGFGLGAKWVTAPDEVVANPLPQLSNEAKAARDFSFEDVRLGMTMDDYLRPRGSNWAYYAHRTQLTTTGKIITDPDPVQKVSHTPNTAKICYLYFLDKKCIRITIVYEEDYIVKMGGVPLFIEKIKRKFGPAHSATKGSAGTKEPETVTWNFDEVARSVSLSIVPGTGDIQLEVVDTLATNAASEKKLEQADFGIGK